MRSTFKVLFYVKKGSEKPNGNLPLMCRITVDGEIKGAGYIYPLSDGLQPYSGVPAPYLQA